MDTVGELLGLGEVGELALHPDGITVRAVGDGTVDGAVAATLEAEVTLTGTGSVPVEEDLDTKALGDGAGLVVALALGLSSVVGSSLGLIGDGRLLDGSDDSIVEALEVGLGQPVVLNGLELGTELALLLSSDHEVVEGLDVRVGAAHDEGVVAGVDGGGDEGSSLGIGSGDGNEVRAYGWVSLAESLVATGIVCAYP